MGLQDWGCRIGAVGSGLGDWGCRTRDKGLGIRDWGCRIWAAGLGLWDLGCRSRAAGAGLQERGCKAASTLPTTDRAQVHSLAPRTPQSVCSAWPGEEAELMNTQVMAKCFPRAVFSSSDAKALSHSQLTPKMWVVGGISYRPGAGPGREEHLGNPCGWAPICRSRAIIPLCITETLSDMH